MREINTNTLTGGCLCGAVRYRTGMPTPKVLRGFCGSCGTALTYWEADWPTEFSLTIASLDDPGLVVPADHTWMAHAVPWDSPTDGLPQHQTDRP
jgi:hypothetical protein